MSESKVNDLVGSSILDPKWYATLYQMLPNVKAEADESKGFALFREFKAARDEFEYTLYYRTVNGYQGSVKKRVDFNVAADLIELGVEHVHPEDARITYWGDAVRGVV